MRRRRRPRQPPRASAGALQIPAEQRDFTLVECVRPERCTEQVQNGELDFFLDEPDELEKQRSGICRPAYPIAQLPPGKESFMTFADSASARLLRGMTRGWQAWRRALYQRWNSEVPGAVQALSAQ